LLTGYKLAKISVFKEMFSKGKYQWVPFITTIVAVVFTDLLKGVMIGLAVSVFAILRGSIKMPYYFHRKQNKRGEVIHIELAQEVSFLNKASIKMTLDRLPDNSQVWIDASNSQYIDYDVLELIREFKNVQAPDRDITLDLTGFKAEYDIENTSNGITAEMEQIKAEMYQNKKLGVPSAEKELIDNN
jgi:carbonic anhydrase